MQNTVPFDPGYSGFSIQIPAETALIFDQIAKLKQNHKKKFEFQKFEARIIPAIKRCASIYLGCILWGAYLFYRHKDDPREISGNVIMELPPEKREELDYAKEIDFIAGLAERLNKSSIYYLRRPSKIESFLVPYFDAYREFCRINDNFKSLTRTDRIKLPEEVGHFGNYSSLQLDGLKSRIEEIIASGDIESLLEIGFYSV